MKYQDVVLVGKTSPSVAPTEPAPRSVTYEVVIALACHVIGPVEPTVWKLTASFLPAMAVLSSAALCPSPFTYRNFTESLHTLCPGCRVSLVAPPLKVTGWFVVATISAPVFCIPTKAPSRVIGRLPNRFVK